MIFVPLRYCSVQTWLRSMLNPGSTPTGTSTHSHSSEITSSLDSQYQYASSDHRNANPFTKRWPFSEKRESENRDEHQAELIDGRHL